MNKLLLLPLLALGACGSSDSVTATTTTAPQKEECADIRAQGGVMVGKQMRSYFAVPHFNPKSKACWQKLRGYAKSEDAPLGLGSGVNLLVFIDTTNFSSPTGGTLSDAARQRMIAQQLLNKDAGIDEFTADPQATGKYAEAK